MGMVCSCADPRGDAESDSSILKDTGLCATKRDKIPLGDQKEPDLSRPFIGDFTLSEDGKPI